MSKKYVIRLDDNPALFMSAMAQSATIQVGLDAEPTVGWVAVADSWVAVADGWVIVGDGWVVVGDGWVVVGDGWVVVGDVAAAEVDGFVAVGPADVEVEHPVSTAARTVIPAPHLLVSCLFPCRMKATISEITPFWSGAA